MKPLIEPLNGVSPQIAEGCFVAPTAQLIGDVQIGEGSSIWYNAVLRGDVFPIRIGKDTNVQDGSILHGTHKECGVVLGDRVTIGHAVVLHGCHIDDGSLIGMGSIVMDHAKIGKNSIVGAGSLVTEKSEFEDEMLILGRPARAKRKLTEEELKELKESADNYSKYMSWYEKEK